MTYSVRDPKTGKFKKASDFPHVSTWSFAPNETQADLNRQIDEYISKLVRPRMEFVRWLSHNRLDVLAYTLYVIVCFLAGACGAFLGIHW